MKNIIGILEKHYHSLKSEQRDQNFFLGLADYVKYIIETPSLNQAIKSIEEERQKDIKEFKIIEKEAKPELEKAQKKAKKEIIKLFKIITPIEKKICKEIEKDPAIKLESPLKIIHNSTLAKKSFEAFKDEKFLKKLFHSFVIKKHGISSLEGAMMSTMKKYASSPICVRYFREKEHHEYLSETTTWGSWHKLKLIYDLIHQRKRMEQKIENEKNPLMQVGYMVLSGKIDMVLKRQPLLPFIREFHKFIEFFSIKKEQNNNLAQNLNQDTSWFTFTKNNYDIHLDRVHRYLIKEWNKKERDKEPSGELEKGLKKVSIKIKNVRLDKQNYLLEINNGEEVIPFRSKKRIRKPDIAEEGLTPEEEEQLMQGAFETKQCKTLFHLWDFRWEIKNGNILRKGDFVSLENLKKGSECSTTEATYQHIKRLRNRFNNEGVDIKIERKNEKYRLVINKS